METPFDQRPDHAADDVAEEAKDEDLQPSQRDECMVGVVAEADHEEDEGKGEFATMIVFAFRRCKRNEGEGDDVDPEKPGAEDEEFREECHDGVGGFR